MKKFLAIFLAVALGSFIGSRLPVAHAQTTVQNDLEFVSVKTACAPVTGETIFCFAADSGLWLSLNGATSFTQVGAAVTAGVQKVNGVAPGATGNITLSCPGTTPTTNVTVTPALSASGATATITATGSVPSMTVTNNCTAVGN